jgi:hypothetical protein
MSGRARPDVDHQRPLLMSGPRATPDLSANTRSQPSRIEQNLTAHGSIAPVYASRCDHMTTDRAFVDCVERHRRIRSSLAYSPRRQPRSRVGLPLITRLAERVEIIDYAPTGTEVRMTFAVDPDTYTRAVSLAGSVFRFPRRSILVAASPPSTTPPIRLAGDRRWPAHCSLGLATTMRATSGRLHRR